MNKLTNKIIQSMAYAVMLVGIVSLTACGGSQVDGGKELLSCELPLIPDAAGTSCVAPPAISCPAPTVPNETNDQCVIGADPDAPTPSVFPGELQAVLYYNRAGVGATNVTGDPSYDGYRLHTWNNDTCDSLAADSIAASWSNGLTYSGIDPNYGAYWLLNLKEGYGDCANFIIHIGTDDAGKEMGGGDWSMNLVQDDPDFVRMNWTLSGYPAVFEYPITSLGELPLQIKDFAAHWIDATTLVWDIDTALATEFRLHHSPSAGIEADENDAISGTNLVLQEIDLTAEQQAQFPQFANWAAFQGDWTADEAKAVLKDQMVLAAYNTEGAYLATYVQSAKALDALYTAGETDADEASLGVSYSADSIDVALWAPTAQSVKLKIYDAAKALTSRALMTEDLATGIWHYSGALSLDRQFYRYEIVVYHPQNNAIETVEVTDPYSVSLSTNGMYSQFVNLNDDDLKPDGWDTQTISTIVDPEDAVIYEAHIRDFSVRDESTSEANRGKYLAFTESGSAPMQHLSDLAANGLTHFHLLPANDIATINEDPANLVNLNDTVADLCAVNDSAPVCGVESDTDTLLSVLQSYTPYSADAQALVEAMRGFDSFNWGYDPKHFNVPDGSYASNAEGPARILEMRAMNQALHETGLRVVLDVVYNHTNSSGLWENSVFDKVVPGYYHRRDLTTGSVQRSTCCDDTALEHRMMDKFMNDSLLLWAEHYKFDGFRFDIMSHGSKAQMLAARDKVRAIDPDNYFYGEGWDRNDGRSETQAGQVNMAGTEIATFNDRLREGIRTAALFKGSDGDMNEQDVVKLGMAGTLANYVLESSNGVASTGSSFSRPSYALDPADVINYVSKHDDNTLWDQLQFNLPFEMSLDDRVRSQNIAIAIPLMSQGIPFLQLGGDLLRSKSMDRNSYDAGDWFNTVDFTKNSNNWNVGLPLAQDNQNAWNTIIGLASSPLTQTSMSDVMFASSTFKEFLSIRRDSKLFRLTTEADVLARIGFHNIGRNQKQGVIVMSIDDGTGLTDLDPASDAIVVMVNATGTEQSHTVPTATGFSLHPTLAVSADARVTSATFSQGTDEGTFTVPARTMAVFVKAQGASQGEGLSAYATSGAPDVVPYGATEIYIRGDMNGWSTDNPLTYISDGIYRTTIELTAATGYGFKVASEDWSTVDFGSADGTVLENTDKTLSRGAGNLSFTPSVDGAYFFELDASDPEAPIINVRNSETYAATAIYIRGAINGWGTASELVHIGDGVYKVIVDVANSGVQEFKIASEDWSTVDLSFGDGEAAVIEDEAKLIGPGAGLGNLSMDFTEIGEYTFLFDTASRTQRYLTVHQTRMYGDQAIYLKGSFNGWGNDDELVYQGDSIYTFDKTLVAGDYEFKFANADWSDINYGAEADDQDISFGVAKILTFNSSNIKLSIPADGTYRFTVTGPNDKAPSMTVTAL